MPLFSSIILEELQQKFCGSHICSLKFSIHISKQNWCYYYQVALYLIKQHAMTWESGGITPWIFNLSIRLIWVVGFSLWPIYSKGNSPGTHLIRDLVGPKANLDAVVAVAVWNSIISTDANKLECTQHKFLDLCFNCLHMSITIILMFQCT
jgi:hypothetical protein